MFFTLLEIKIDDREGERRRLSAKIHKNLFYLNKIVRQLTRESWPRVTRLFKLSTVRNCFDLSVHHKSLSNDGWKSHTSSTSSNLLILVCRSYFSADNFQRNSRASRALLFNLFHETKMCSRIQFQVARLFPLSFTSRPITSRNFSSLVLEKTCARTACGFTPSSKRSFSREWSEDYFVDIPIVVCSCWRLDKKFLSSDKSTNGTNIFELNRSDMVAITSMNFIIMPIQKCMFGCEERIKKP